MLAGVNLRVSGVDGPEKRNVFLKLLAENNIRHHCRI
jgi:hypothetical protein